MFRSGLKDAFNLCMVAQKSTVTLFHWLCGSVRLSWIDWSLNGFPPSLSIKPFSYSISDCSVFSHRDHIYILTYWVSSGASQRCCSKGVIQIPTGNLTTKIHFSECSSARFSSPNCHEPRKRLVFFRSHPVSALVPHLPSIDDNALKPSAVVYFLPVCQLPLVVTRHCCILFLCSFTVLTSSFLVKLPL